MSLAVAEAPAPVKTIANVTPQEAAEFRAKHLPNVEKCIKAVQQQIKPGMKLRRVITPTTDHDQIDNASPVRENFEAIGCVHAIMMKGLYRAMCPVGIELSHDYDTTTIYEKTDDDEHMVKVTMLVLIFFVPTEHTRPPKKKR